MDCLTAVGVRVMNWDPHDDKACTQLCSPFYYGMPQPESVNIWDGARRRDWGRVWKKDILDKNGRYVFKWGACMLRLHWYISKGRMSNKAGKAIWVWNYGVASLGRMPVCVWLCRQCQGIDDLCPEMSELPSSKLVEM